MYAVEFEKERRLLRLTFAQRVGRDEAVACMARVSQLLEASPGPFRLLTDLSAVESMDLACEPLIDQTMDLCNRAGIEMVVRVVPDPRQDIGFGIMSLFHYDHKIPILTCRTLAEAEAALK